MSETITKKPRKMSAKGFLSKITKPNVSAAGFISAYREFMLTGELSYVLSPIIARVDAGDLLPTPALVLISNATMYHQIASDTIKAEKAIEEQQNPTSVKPKNWTATIYDSKDVIQVRINPKGEEENLIKSFDVSGDADRWVDRRLSLDGQGDWYAVIQHSHSNVRVVIMRNDAMARFYRQAKKPTMKAQSKSTGALSFRPHVKESRSTFSRG